MAIHRDEVVRAALELLDEVGLEGLTMRRLAERMRIQAPSLYWHFPGKEALIDAMADAIIVEVGHRPPAEPASLNSWEAGIEGIATELYAALRRRRDGARVYGGTYVVSDNTLRVSNALIATLRASGASPRTAAWGTFTLLNFVLGFTLEEQGLPPAEQGAPPLDKIRARFTDAAAGYPALREAVADIFHPDQTERFAFGLSVQIAGLKAMIDRDLATTKNRPSEPALRPARS